MTRDFFDVVVTTDGFEPVVFNAKVERNVTWNGWEVAYFDLETCFAIADEFHKAPDQYMRKIDNDWVITIRVDEHEWETTYHSPVNIDGKMYWPIGDGWCWFQIVQGLWIKITDGMYAGTKQLCTEIHFNTDVVSGVYGWNFSFKQDDTDWSAHESEVEGPIVLIGPNR